MKTSPTFGDIIQYTYKGQIEYALVMEEGNMIIQLEDFFSNGCRTIHETHKRPCPKYIYRIVYKKDTMVIRQEIPIKKELLDLYDTTTPEQLQQKQNQHKEFLQRLTKEPNIEKELKGIFESELFNLFRI